jgi:hypothetical protein
MRQRCDVYVPKDSEAVFVHRFPLRVFGTLVSLLGVFKGLSGQLLPGFMILLVMRYGCTPMSVCGKVMQLGGSLMILVM